jgi:hypothetical protein
LATAANAISSRTRREKPVTGKTAPHRGNAHWRSVPVSQIINKGLFHVLPSGAAQMSHDMIVNVVGRRADRRPHFA